MSKRETTVGVSTDISDSVETNGLTFVSRATERDDKCEYRVGVGVEARGPRSPDEPQFRGPLLSPTLLAPRFCRRKNCDGSKSEVVSTFSFHSCVDWTGWYLASSIGSDVVDPQHQKL